MTHVELLSLRLHPTKDRIAFCTASSAGVCAFYSCGRLCSVNDCLCRLQYERSARPGALAAGKDHMRLQSRVQILDNEYEGYYMIGGLQTCNLGPIKG